MDFIHCKRSYYPKILLSKDPLSSSWYDNCETTTMITFIRKQGDHHILEWSSYTANDHYTLYMIIILCKWSYEWLNMIIQKILLVLVPCQRTGQGHNGNSRPVKIVLITIMMIRMKQWWKLMTMLMIRMKKLWKFMTMLMIRIKNGENSWQCWWWYGPVRVRSLWQI